jgi:hypothetical protein
VSRQWPWDSAGRSRDLTAREVVPAALASDWASMARAKMISFALRSAGLITTVAQSRTLWRFGAGIAAAPPGPELDSSGAALWLRVEQARSGGSSFEQ